MKTPPPSLPVALPLGALALGSLSLHADPSGADILSSEEQDYYRQLAEDMKRDATPQTSGDSGSSEGRPEGGFEKELAILRGRVDGLESRVSELEATQFSTTTKLRGNLTFVFPGGGAGGGSTGFNDRTRLQLDTSFTGDDRLLLRFSGNAGHTGNANEELGIWPFNPNAEASGFFSLGTEFLYQFPLGDQGSGYLGANLGYIRFEDEIPTQQDDSKNLYDLDLNFGAYYRISDRFNFSTKNWLNHSDIGGFGRTIRQGVLDEELTTFTTENYFNYLVNGPFSGTSGFRFKLSDESGGSDFDSDDHSFIQEFSVTPDNGRTAIYLNGVYGGRSYDNRLWNFDSTYHQLNGGVRGFLPCGVRYDIAGGYEWRNYDDSFYGDENNFRFEASVLGQPREGLTLAFLCGYGVQNLLPNYGGFGIADPLGWMLMFRAQQSLGDFGDLGISLEHSILEGQVTNAPVEPEFERFSTEIYYNFPIHENIIITPSVIFTSLSNNTQDDDFFVGSVRTTFRF